MIELTRFIREHGLEKLCLDYAIKAKRHKDYNNLILLKYSQLDSPMGEKVVQQCRGIILDENDDWRIVNYSYSKFFNHGEGHAAEIDWDTARVYEKADGSLLQLYYYAGRWQVATSGLPDASGEVLNTNTTFADLFWKVWGELRYKLPEDTNHCYAFELMTPYNRIVVRHRENKLLLHGGRNLTTLRELNPVVEAHSWGWDKVNTYPLTSWDEIETAAKEIDPMEGEGYVVADANYNRVKVKSPSYVAIAHIKDTFSTRRILEIVRTNENSEFLSYYPEFTNLYYEIRLKYERLLGEMEGYYDGIKDIEDQKQFALKATKKMYSSSMFNMRYNNINSFKEALSNMQIKLLEKWLDIKLVNL